MPTDYRPMWTELGLDLEAHDALLGVLGRVEIRCGRYYTIKTERQTNI
jgi:hypothetical protein